MDQPPLPPPTVPPKPKRGPLVWILIGVGGLILVGSLCCGGIGYFVYSATKPPADATHAFFDKINAGDLDTAYANSSGGFRATVSREDFTAAFAGLKITDVTLSQRNIENNTATVSGTATVEGQGVMALSVDLIQEGDVWRVEHVGGAFGEFAAGRVPPAD